jgi:hypothetical protein
MYAELAANSHKGDQAAWRTMSLREAWQEISWHSAKLAMAIKEGNEPLIRELSADVANGAMMLVDILNNPPGGRVYGGLCAVCGHFFALVDGLVFYHDGCLGYGKRAKAGSERQVGI